MLFATHYFELTTLTEKMEGVVNTHVDAVEHGKTTTFMHSVQDGAASKSHGLLVAILAGVPHGVIRCARQKLCQLETLSTSAVVDGTQLSQLQQEKQTTPPLEELEALVLDNLSPRQALEWLYRLKKML